MNQVSRSILPAPLPDSRGASKDATGLSIKGLGKFIGEKKVLDDVTIDVQSSEYVSILGRSGSGKTSLLRILAGFEQADSGTVTLNGADLTSLPSAQRGVGVVFQSFALFPHLNVFENVAFGLRYGSAGVPVAKDEIVELTRRALRLVDLQSFEERQIHQLSGGQKQRVALARTIVIKPRILLLDEPLGALDAALRGRMQRELLALQRHLQIPFLHFTGDDAEAISISDRMVVLDHGKVRQIGRPSEILADPKAETVARVIDRFNLVKAGELGSSSSSPDLESNAIVCVPIKAVTVVDETASVSQDDASDVLTLDATFIADERADGRVRSSFATLGGTTVQIERDTGETARSLVPNTSYRLSWKRAAMHVFKGTVEETLQSASTATGLGNAKILRSKGAALLALPAIAWMALFLLLPLAAIVVVSFWTQTTFAIKPDATLANWTNFVSTPAYLSATLTTVKLWAIVMVLSFVVSVPVALYIGLFVQNRIIQTTLIVACIIPFWTSFLIRVLAWRPMLGREGAINMLLQGMGITDAPLDQLLFSELSVVIGMVQIYAVFVVGPVTYMISRIDRNVLEAARDLGANFWEIVLRVVLPLSKPGLLVGAIFVSVMVLGEFATSAALSGRQVNLLGNVIVNQVSTLRWALAAVAGCVLTVLSMLLIGVLLKLVDIRREI